MPSVDLHVDAARERTAEPGGEPARGSDCECRVHRRPGAPARDEVAALRVKRPTIRDRAAAERYDGRWHARGHRQRAVLDLRSGGEVLDLLAVRLAHGLCRAGDAV